MPLLQDKRFHYWSYRDGVCGTIVGQTAICALKKEFGLENIVWSHGSVRLTGVAATYVVTDIENMCQFDVKIREVEFVTGEEF